MPLGVKQFLHTSVIITPNLEENRTFYERILGFKVDESRPPIPATDGCWLNVGDTGKQVHLVYHDKRLGPVGGNPEFDISEPHMAFAVESLDECKKLLDAEGIRFHELTIVGGRRQVFFRDPSGNLIELQQA
ncbi:MAG: VOC family protein [Candidatus Bathyarchaeia archaeon]